MSETNWRRLLPEAVAAIVVLVLGFAEALFTWAITGGRLEVFVQALAIAFAVAMRRRAPAAALAIVWWLGLCHMMFHVPIMAIEFALVAVLYGAARWGRQATLVMSGLSVPLTVIVAVLVHEGRIVSLHLLLSGSRLGDVIRREQTVQVILALFVILLIAGPWFVGLVMRSVDRARSSRVSMLAAEEVAAGAWRETEHAREIAHLRDQQTRLARDVHDVVGHSLAVILAQAESGQYLEETGQLKQTLQTIATSARSSLQDVRQVLSSTQDTSAGPDDVGQLDSLIAGVRGSGHEIVATELGTPRQLPRETGAVAYRVFQEMLTNAIKHGLRGRPITTERHWPAEGLSETLRIEVTNVTDAADDNGPGRGLEGMRRRLESIDGHLDVRRREQSVGTTFTATAYVPVRGGA